MPQVKCMEVYLGSRIPKRSCHTFLFVPWTGQRNTIRFSPFYSDVLERKSTAVWALKHILQTITKWFSRLWLSELIEQEKSSLKNSWIKLYLFCSFPFGSTIQMLPGFSQWGNKFVLADVRFYWYDAKNLFCNLRDPVFWIPRCKSAI